MADAVVRRLEGIGKGKHRSKSQLEAEGLMVMNAKIAGWRDADIAREMGVHTMTVQRRLAYYVANHGQSEVAEYRKITEQQLEVVMRAGVEAMARAAARGELDKDAADLVLRTLDRKAKLLGLDAPVKVEMEHTVQTDQEKALHDLLAQAAEREKQREEEMTA